MRRIGCDGSAAQFAPQHDTIPAASSAYVASPPPVTRARDDPAGAPTVPPQQTGEPFFSAHAEVSPAAAYENAAPVGVARTPETLLPAVSKAPDADNATRNPPPSESALPTVPGTDTAPTPNPVHVPSARWAAKAPLVALTDPANATKGDAV
jgi:hypothetical protein